MACRKDPRRGHALPRLRRDDAASGTMVSFVVGVAVFILGSTVLVGFVVEPPGNPGSGLDHLDLKVKASSALDVLMGTAGYPPEWASTPEEVDKVARLGLVEQGSTVRLDPQKFSALARGRYYHPSDANGVVDYTEARTALGIDNYDFRLRATPLIDEDDEYYGTRGLGDYRVAYVGDWEGVPPAATAASAAEQAALRDLDVGFSNLSRTSVLGSGDVFRDDASILKSVLVPLLGTSVAQVAISSGSGQAFNFNRVNVTDVSHVVAEDPLSASEKVLALARLDSQGTWELGYTKGREIRATIGTVNTSGQTSVVLGWREHVDTRGAGTTPDDGDYGYVEASPDGGATWYPLTNTLTGRSQDSSAFPRTAGVWDENGVTITSINCAACLDNDEVILALHWVADNDNDVGYGWIVDDFTAATPGVSGTVLATKSFETPEYQLVVIGSNVNQEAFTSSEVKNAIRDYVQSYGGRILVLGGEANVQWLQPLFHVSLETASTDVSSSDPTHALLTVPNALDWTGYQTDGRAWDFGGGADEDLFSTVVGADGGRNILTVSSADAFGSDGGVILSSWLPYKMDRNQRLPFLANAITYGHFHQLYMDLGPEVPRDAPVASVSRTAVMMKTVDDEAPEYIEISFVLYLWRGDVSASLPSASRPSAPIGFAGTPGDGTATLSWQAPGSAGASAVQGYVVYRGTSPGHLSLLDDEVNALGYVDQGLSNGVTYYYKVAARNGQGEGSATSELALTPSAPPGAPESPSATGAAGHIIVSWTTPATHGGSAITAYRVYRSTDANVDPVDAGLLAEIGASTSYTDDDLPYPFEAWYRVTAVNGVDESAPSSLVTASTLSVPEAPAQPVAVGGREQITITWTPPASPKPILGYHVFAGNTPGSATYLLSVATPNYTEENLGAAATRYYRVRAWNADGVGGLSPETSGTTLGLSSAPTNPAAAGGPDLVTLTWAPPSDLGGGVVSHYLIYHRTSGGSLALLAQTEHGANTTFQHVGLADNSTHFYRISAVTEAGEGALASEVSGTTYDVAAAPVLAGVAGPGPKAATLTWVAPEYAGGVDAVITEYHVYRGTTSGMTSYYRTVSSGLAFTDDDPGNQALVPYYYVVRAVTASGLGLPSNEMIVIMSAV